VWFAPLPAGSHPDASFQRTGSLDYMSLFDPGSPWSRAASHVRVFKLYSSSLQLTTDANLKRIVHDLSRRHIAIALEAPPLTPRDGCGQGVEGFGGENTVAILDRVKAAGGTVEAIAMDEPLYMASISTDAGGCKWAATAVANDILTWSHGVRARYPRIVIGDIEPLAKNGSPQVYRDWLVTYRAVTSTKLAFFQLDVDWQRASWAEEARTLEASAREEGVPFGMIYKGSWDDDASAWLTHAAERMATYETGGGRPDQVIFQSWDDQPHQVLPETSVTAFTSLIDRYFSIRTRLSIAGGSTVQSGRSATAQLVDGSGMPIAGAPITLKVRALDGPGHFAEYMATGRVPAGATQAVIQISVHQDGAALGPVEFSFYGARYSQPGGPVAQVPNGDFALGLGSWGLQPTSDLYLGPSDRGTGQVLHVAASATQSLVINSKAFAVAAGASFSATFSARVPPASAGKGYFALVFLGPTAEDSRNTIRFEAATDEFDGTTGADGAIHWQLPPMRASSETLMASYAGDASDWPAFASGN
jgi:hypothetical protein